MRKCLYTAGALLLAISLPARAQDKWIIHEWGTFTSLQDESGNAIGGINTDDEPVPSFVHRAGPLAVRGDSEVPNNFFKGMPNCHTEITMRLETPVIYFHPPKSATGIQTASVHVTFHGGLLSEFFPAAAFITPGFDNDSSPFGHLRSDTESRLEWNNLQIGGDWPVTSTSDHVWTSPRAVQSALVQATNGESEQFLFYRGVAHIDAPLKVSRDAASGDLLFRSQLEGLAVGEPLPVRSLWLVDIHPGGMIAFRPLPPISLTDNSRKYLAHTSPTFAPEDYGSGNMEKLKASLLSALVSDGLYNDEARALLNTWELSYFKSAGLRVFFLVPREWTDHYLPLEISQPAEVNRVMVGRIELVTPRQRNILQQIAGFSTNEISHDGADLAGRFVSHFFGGGAGKLSDQQMGRLNVELAQAYSGQKPLSSFITIPKTYQTYLDLGRFRNALILDEARRRPTTGLINFIATYRLQGFPVRENPTAPKPENFQTGSQVALH